MLCAGFAVPAQAQQTKAQMNTYNNSVIVPNGVGGITASNLHPLTQNMINSMCTIADAVNCPITSLSGASVPSGPLVGSATGGGVVQGTRSGTTAVFPVIDGTSNNGECAVFDASGGFTSQACTGSGSGTVGAGIQGQVAGYSATGPSVVGVPLSCTPIETFGGGIGASSVNNVAAYNSVLAASPFAALGGCVGFGPGQYQFAGPLVATYPTSTGEYTVSVRGAGPDATKLLFNIATATATTISGTTLTAGGTVTSVIAPGQIVTGSGITANTTVVSGSGTTWTITPSQTVSTPTLGVFTPSGLSFVMGATTHPTFHVSDLALVTNGPGSGGSTALSASFLAVQQAHIMLSDITNVTIHSDAIDAVSPNQHYWANGIVTTGVSGVNMNNVDIIGSIVGAPGPGTGGLGNGITVTGYSVLTSFGVLFNLSNSNLEYLSHGFTEGELIQGVSIVNTNINFNTLGVLVPSGITPGALGVAGLLISNSYLSNYNNDISILSPFDSLQLNNNNILVFPSTTGVFCDSCSDTVITGNVINAEATGHVGEIGISASNNAAGNSGSILITGNSFGNLADAVVISSGVSGLTVQSNKYNSNTSNVINNGTITAGSCAGIAGTCTAGATP